MTFMFGDTWLSPSGRVFKVAKLNRDQIKFEDGKGQIEYRNKTDTKGWILLNRINGDAK